MSLSLIGPWTPAFGFQIHFPLRFIMETECCCHDCKKRTFRIYVFIRVCMYAFMQVNMHLCIEGYMCMCIIYVYLNMCLLCWVISVCPRTVGCVWYTSRAEMSVSLGSETLNLKGCFVSGLQQQSTLHYPVSLTSKQPQSETPSLYNHTVQGIRTEQRRGPGKNNVTLCLVSVSVSLCVSLRFSLCISVSLCVFVSPYLSVCLSLFLSLFLNIFSNSLQYRSYISKLHSVLVLSLPTLQLCLCA